MKEERFRKILVDRYLNNQATDEELEVFMNLLTESKLDDEISEAMDYLLKINQKNIIRVLPSPYKTKRWKIFAVAASIFAFSLTAYLIQSSFFDSRNVKSSTEILPGVKQATLTLSDGRRILLTDKLKGKLASQDNAIISVGNAHSIIYNSQKSLGQKHEWNTLSTGKGEQSPYPLVLSDGTKVLLDAQSKITFPASFSTGERRVKVDGKAWFNVIHDIKRPFYVETAGQITKDLGTEFIIDAYSDQPMAKTVLIKGSVSVKAGRYICNLKPGQVVSTYYNKQNIKLDIANIKVETAWMEDKFCFSNEDIKSVMNELGRWYDFEVIYGPALTTDRFNGIISRKKTISEVLAMLESTNLVHFKVNGRRVMVMK